MRKAIQLSVRILLIAIIVWGAFRSITAARAKNVAQAELDRIRRIVGSIEITSPDLVHVRAIEPTEPMKFSWRIYVPVNRGIDNRVGIFGPEASSSISWRTPEAKEYISRLEFFVDSSGFLRTYFSSFMTSRVHCSHSWKVNHFLRQHWDELEIEIGGLSETAILKPDEKLDLVRIHLPPNVLEELKRELPEEHESLREGDIVVGIDVR